MIAVLLALLLVLTPSFPADTIDELNVHRNHALNVDIRLMTAAQERAVEIGLAGFIPYGHPGWDKTVRKHYPVRCAAETVTILYNDSVPAAIENGWTATPENAVRLLLDSKPHRAVLLGAYKYVGVGKAPYYGEHYHWVVVILLGSC